MLALSIYAVVAMAVSTFAELPSETRTMTALESGTTSTEV